MKKSLQLRILSLLTLICLGVGSAWSATYTKITSTEGLTDGKYLIVYEGNKALAFNGALTTLDATSNTVEVTINGNSITTSSACFFTIAAVEGGYSVMSQSGYYIGNTSDTNALKTSNETAYVNTISFDAEGNANIVSSSSYLRYNSTSNQTRFRYYKSGSYTGQKPVSLFKEVPSGEDPETYTVTYDANGGDGTMTDASSPYEVNSLVTVLANEFTREGYTFLSWNTESDGEGDSYAVGETFTITADVILYAQWEENSVDPGTSTTYTKITSTEDLTDGKYLIVYEAGNLAFNGSLTTLDAIGNSVAVTISDNSISTSDACYFTVAAVEGGYSILSQSGLYIGNTSDANALKTSDETAYVNSISFDAEGNANIVSSSSYLRYNSTSNQTRFRYYKSGSYTGQQPVCLYKEVVAPVPAPAAPTLALNGEKQVILVAAGDCSIKYYIEHPEATEAPRKEVSKSEFLDYTAGTPITMESGDLLYTYSIDSEGVESPIVCYDYSDYVATAVENIAADLAAGARYYNLQGVEVANPSQGIFIRVRGSKVDKVVVR